MKKLIFLFSIIAFELKAQDVVVPDTIKQISIGFNLLKLAGNNGSAVQQVGFLRNRVRNHAFKFSFYSTGYYSGNNAKQINTPQAIAINDTLISLTSEYISQTSSGISLSYEKFQLSSADKSIELFSGIGLRGGATHHDHGSHTLVYSKDTLGNFNYSDSLSYSSPQFLLTNSYKQYTVGLLPYAGVLFMPNKVLSIDLQISFPLSYTWKIPASSAIKRSFGFSTEMLYSINIILNFNFKESIDTL